MSEWPDNFLKFPYVKFQDDPFRSFKTLHMRTNRCRDRRANRRSTQMRKR